LFRCIPAGLPSSSLGKVFLTLPFETFFGASKNRLHSFSLEAGEKYRLTVKTFATEHLWEVFFIPGYLLEELIE